MGAVLSAGAALLAIVVARIFGINTEGRRIVRLGLVAIPLSLGQAGRRGGHRWRRPSPPRLRFLEPCTRRLAKQAVARTDRTYSGRHGRWPGDTLHPGSEDGTVLDTPIPDNPLVPGIAHVIALWRGPAPSTRTGGTARRLGY